MKAYLLTTGGIFSLFALSHFVITYEHWRGQASDFWFVAFPAIIAAVGTALAVWAFRLIRRAGPVA
jgi:hypothetical protein